MSLDEDARAVFAAPLLKFLGARFEGWKDGAAITELSVGPGSLNANARAHGGALYTLLDVTAYLAILPMLDAGQTAVTHNSNVSFMSASALGSEIRFEARVLHRGRSLAVVQAEGRTGNRIVAAATVCKSIIVLR